MRPKLIPLGMVICDTVIQDIKTRKKSLIGIFSQINAVQAPVHHPRMSVFLVLTEGNGRYGCELRCLREEDGLVVMKAQGEIEFKDPQQVLELVFDLNGPIFPAFGQYRFEFLAEQEPVISRKFAIIKSQMPHQEEKGGGE